MSKILVIEDDSSVSLVYQRAFTLAGYEVTTAFDGEDGFNQSVNANPTIILLDIRLPKMDGLTVLRKLKNDPKTASIPVVMLSNVEGDREVEEAIALGAVKYIIKSELDPSQVVELVKKILANI